MRTLAVALAALALAPSALAEPFTLIQVERGGSARAVPALRLHRAEPVSRSLRVWRVRTEVARQILPGLRAERLVRSAEPDAVVGAAGHITSGDPLVPQQRWLALVGADRVEPPGPGKPVTVIDSGLDLLHPEFAARPGTTALNAQTTLGRDEHHGTAVSSLVGAPANGIGLVGVYPQAVLNSWDAAPGGRLTVGDIVSGLDAASAAGAGVINLSLGSSEPSDILKHAVYTAVARGSLVVAASGNSREEGNPLEFPASLAHVLTVAATTDQNQVAQFSSASPAVDLAAPGDRIPIAVPATFRPTGFSFASGTSFSAPIVSGAAAWVWTARPELDNTQLFELLRSSARDVGAPGFDEDTGFGVLDIPAALAAPAPPRDPQEPNDDIDQVRASGLFETAKPLLTSPNRLNATLLASVDESEDPEDVYRVFLRARSTVTVTLKPQADVELEAWLDTAESVLEREVTPVPRRLARSGKPGAATETVTLTNRSARGSVVYVDVRPAEGTRSSSYRLTITTKPLPKPKR